MCKYIECDGKCDQCNMLTAMEGCKCGSYLSRYGCDDCPYREEVTSHETSQKADTQAENTARQNAYEH